jgi:hypothetical protein
VGSDDENKAFNAVLVIITSSMADMKNLKFFIFPSTTENRKSSTKFDEKVLHDPQDGH